MSNRLTQEKSPYLLQHADNPVDWFAGGEAVCRRHLFSAGGSLGAARFYQGARTDRGRVETGPRKNFGTGDEDHRGAGTGRIGRGDRKAKTWREDSRGGLPADRAQLR